MKRQLNAANNILNLANKALKKKENNKAPTLMERGSYTSKINTQMRKLAKGTTNQGTWRLGKEEKDIQR